MKFLIACGGTAGHINPGLAAADALRALLPGSDFLFVGSGRKMESKLVPEAGYKLRNIVMRGLERGISPKTLVSDAQALWLLVSASRKAAKLVREFAPDFVLGTGGYICYPVLTAAARLGIKTAIHESNAVPGLTSKLLSGKVTRVFTAFEGMGMLFSASDRVVATGTPVRSDFFGYNREKARKELGIDADTRLVVSFWGSLGASKMNEVMAEMIRRNAERRAFCQIHAIGGASDIEKFKLAALGGESCPGHIEIRQYIDDMPRVMAAADLVLCRAGASTLAELSAVGRGAVLVPSPYVTNDHQTHNAKMVVRHGGALMLSEAECGADKLFDAVSGLIGSPLRLRKMEESQRSLGAVDASERIAAEILALM